MLFTNAFMHESELLKKSYFPLEHTYISRYNFLFLFFLEGIKPYIFITVVQTSKGGRSDLSVIIK
jgi:hypothetical protein